MNRKPLAILLAVVAAIVMFASCGSKDGGSSAYPPENLSDTAKIAYMMQRYEPDSVARYICCTFLGWNKGCTLDTMATAVTYAYGKYTGPDLTKFGTEFDNFANNLPLAQRMQLMYNAAMHDPITLGYELGLEYAGEIQSKGLKLADIDKEMQALKSACADDTVTYLRVLKGLSEALSQPEYEGIPADIVAKYGVAPKLPVIDVPVIEESK